VVGNGLLPVSPDHEDFILFRGEDGYEGLSAIVDAGWDAAPATITGSIFSGELPAAPTWPPSDSCPIQVAVPIACNTIEAAAG
jgi:hypothetical protein